MKIIILGLILLVHANIIAQTMSPNLINRDNLIGEWEYVNGNKKFKVNLFNKPDGDGTFSLAGHFSKVEIDSAGNETIIYTSDRPMDTTIPKNWIPVINGGRYLSYNESYKFSLMDNTTNYLLRGVLYLKFLKTSTGSPLQISWKLIVDGMSDDNEVFNVPTDIILIKNN